MPDIPDIAPESTRVGWIGTGVMGHSMVGHLMTAGYRCDLQTRTPAKAADLVQRGAVIHPCPADVAAAADVVFTIVGMPADVRDVYCGGAGLFSSCRPGQIFVDMTTSEPALAIEIAQIGGALGVTCLDAPVSGGDAGAREARLSIMIGGDARAVAAIDPLLQLMGKTIVHQGAAGFGQHTKMVNQTLIATTMIGVCEAMLYGYRAGLDIDKVLQSVSSGAAGSVALSVLAPRMIRGDFDPGFFVEHFVKDMGIALNEAARMNLALPGLALARQLYLAVMAQGHGRLGTQALLLALAKVNNMALPISETSPR